jgi:tetratricopeptide (TPR) repeat protein
LDPGPTVERGRPIFSIPERVKPMTESTQARRRIKFLWTGALVCVVLIFAPGLVSGQTYWFETYQRAVEYIEQERLEEAAKLLEELIERRPLPQARVRVPGNQFVDYLPYYQRARIEVRLGDRTRAIRSLEVSEAFGAIKSNRRALTSLKEMRVKLEQQPADEKKKPVANL